MNKQRALERLIRARASTLETIFEYASKKEYTLVEIFVESVQMYDVAIAAVRNEMRQETGEGA